MKQFLMIFIIGMWSAGCKQQLRPEELAVRHRAEQVLGNTEGAIQLYLRLSSNNPATTDFQTIVRELARRDAVLNELLTKRVGGSMSLAILNTNLSAWTESDSHRQDIAVILPDRIQKDDRSIYIGIRFSGEVVYFTTLLP